MFFIFVFVFCFVFDLFCFILSLSFFTTYRYNNLKTIKQASKFSNLLSEQHALIWTPAFAYVGNHVHVFKAIKKARQYKKHLKFAMQDTRHFLAMVKFWKNYGIKSILSTGFYFVTSALDLCDQVNVYGFWPFNTTADGRTLAYHYYHDDITLTEHHSMPSEFLYLAAMHDLGLLQLHVGNCSSTNND